MKKLFLSVFIILITASIQHSIAQQGEGQRGMSGGGRMMMEGGFGTLKGTIIDETTGAPIEYANIVIYRQKDSTLVTGGITDIKGNFKIEKVPFGRYYIDFKFIGYKNNRILGVMVTPRQTEVTLEPVKLKSASENIEEIVVTGQKSMLQSNLDKTVINVDRNINVEGGTALDIMRNIPAVEVDVEGNVSVRGSSNLTILVDGRPSQINSLEELPANLVQSVELITNPSVRYDPDGLSGILNIVLVKKKTPGYHGMVSVNAGTGNKYSGTVNFNMRQSRMNYFANIDYRYFGSDGSGISNRVSQFINPFTGIKDTSYTFQNSETSRGGLSTNLRGGFDFFINQKNTFSVTASGNIRNMSSDDDRITTKFLDLNASPNEDYIRNTEGKTYSFGGDIALNYKRTFDKQGQEFTSDLYFSKSNRESDNDYEQVNNLIDAPKFQKSFTGGESYSFTFQSDLVLPIGNGGRFETGIKGIYRNQDSDYLFDTLDIPNNLWNTNLKTSNRFVLTDQIYAGYAIYSNTIGPFSYQAGIRVEDQIKKADQQTTDSVVNVSFFNIFPSAHIKWDINKVNAVKVSYTRRVNRPSGMDLNPFINREDEQNLSQGNPWLEPEFTDSYEIAHFLNLSSTSLNSTFFYRNRTNLISRETKLIENTDTTLTYPKNLTAGSTLGFEFILNQKLTKWWKMNGSYSYFKAKINDDTINESASESKSWTAKLTSSFSIGKNFEVQINGNYRSPVITGIGGSGGHRGGGGGSQGKSKEMYSVDLGLRYMVFNKKGTLTLRVSDIFNTRQFETDSWGTNFTSYQKNIHESRIVFIGFSYRINDYKQRRDTKMDEMNEFENQ